MEKKTGQIFESEFHKRYVGGEGQVVVKPLPQETSKIEGQTVEEIRAEYRKYVGDPLAELPEEILAELRKIGKIPE